MLAAIHAFDMPTTGTWPRTLLANSTPEELRSIFNVARSNECAGVLLEHGLLTEARFMGLAPLFRSLRPKESIGGLSHRDLASPVLSEKSIIEIASDLPRYPLESRLSVACALRANPNAPENLPGLPSPPTFPGMPPDEWEGYITALAKHGDLTNEKTVGYLTAHLFDTEAGDKSVAHEAKLLLSGRDGLPPYFVQSLIRTGKNRSLKKLMMGDTHRQMVRDGTASFHSLSSPFVKAELLISPEATQEQLEVLYNMRGTDDMERVDVGHSMATNAIAAHSNTKKEWVEEAIDSDNERDLEGLSRKMLASQTPHLEWALPKLLEMGSGGHEDFADFGGASSKLLDQAAAVMLSPERVGDPMPLVSHPNFNWENHPIDEILAMPDFDKDTFVCVLAAASLNGAVNGTDAGKYAAAGLGIGVLFNPSLSGFRLAQLVEAHPDLLPFAAIHPNGADLPIAGIPSEEKHIVNSIRQERQGLEVLAGKSNALPHVEITTLEI